MRRAATAASLLAVALLVGACGSDESSGEGEEPAAKAKPEVLRVEATEGPRGTELIVYVIDAAANTRAAAGGKRKVNLRCFDKARATIVDKPHAYPFTDTDGGLTDPHVHQRLSRTQATQVSRCELEGTRRPMSAEVTSTGFE